MQPGLRAILNGIQPAHANSGPAHFIARPIPATARHFVGWDHLRAPCVLVETLDIDFRAPLQLSGLEVQYCQRCNVNFPDGDCSEKILTVISCSSVQVETQDYFLHLMLYCAFWAIGRGYLNSLTRLRDLSKFSSCSAVLLGAVLSGCTEN
jgi:hypothetical protein